MHKDIFAMIILISNKKDKIKIKHQFTYGVIFSTYGNIRLQKAYLPGYKVGYSSWSSRTSLEHDSCCRLIQRLYLHWIPFVPCINLEVRFDSPPIFFTFSLLELRKELSGEDRNGKELRLLNAKLVFNCLPLTYSVLVKHVPIFNKLMLLLVSVIQLQQHKLYSMKCATFIAK